MVGVFTGEFVNGAPVYRLPALTVVARRDAGLARTGRGDTLARARPTRAGPVAIPQVQPIGGAAVVVRTRGE